MAISPDIMAGLRPQVLELAIPKVRFVPVENPELIPTELAGQKWLITGASRANGIGASIARLAGSRGAEVFCTSTLASMPEADGLMRNLSNHGITAHWIASDLRKPGAGKTLVEESVKRMGSLDVVVNNAGRTYDNTLGNLTWEMYQEALSLGVLAPFEIKQAAIEAMVAAGKGGNIVDISSVSRWGQLGQMIYASIKAAEVAQQQALSDEFARRRRIRSNALEVGIVAGTPMTESLKDSMIEKLAKGSGGERAVLQSEVAEAVIITASPYRSGNITRGVLQVLGGENYGVLQIEPLAA